MWNGKHKALTFSYDDGQLQDLKMLEIFNKYNLKCTLNLSSGLFIQEGNPDYHNEMHSGYLSVNDLKQYAKGHEIACHSLTHPSLPDCGFDKAFDEVYQDKLMLEKTFNTKIHGMAYPFGAYDDMVKQIVANCGLHYARTVEASHSFDIQQNKFAFNPTCHHNDNKLEELIDTFINTKATKKSPMLFYIWGHSWEFDGGERNWEYLDKLCAKLSNLDDVYYGTNAEVFNLC